MTWLPASVLLLALTLGTPAWAQAGTAVSNHPPCDMPQDLLTPTAPLHHVAATLAAGEDVEILALGSGSTIGESGRSGGPAPAYHTPGASFPYRMLDALRALRPSARFHLTVKGARKMTAEAMSEILRQELAVRRYTLVIWQTGTVEAVRGLRPNFLNDVLQDGVDAAVKADADVVLVDPQFSRFLRANTDLSPYEAVLQQVAGLPEVSLFHRFDLTRLWVDTGQVDLERASRDQRDKTVALLNTCLGHALARYVLNGAEER
jgi:acyl-CoA thioesterase-1